jgi:hypothetical protein
MPRPPNLFFSDRAELEKLLSRLKVLEKPKKPKGRPYDPEDLELCALWSAEREGGKKWLQIAKKRLPGNPAGLEKVKQAVRRYRSFCAKQGIKPKALLTTGALLLWAEEWEKNVPDVDLLRWPGSFPRQEGGEGTQASGTSKRSGLRKRDRTMS